MTEIAVVGAGLMGHALALVFGLGGHKARLTDNNPDTLAKAQDLMGTALATLAEVNEPTAASKDRPWLSTAVPIEQDRTGVMSSRGFFDWGGRSAEELFQECGRKLLALKQALRNIRPMEGT